MKYATVCSGIEAPTVAWHGLGLNPVWFSEIEPFPCKLLKHHYPNVPNLGDMTKLNEHETYRNTTIDLLCGGTPCQSFSIAGLRGGLDDDRGNLALEYCRILIAKRPRWFVWENVPGVFSSNGGKDFACILSAFTGTEVNPAGIGNAGIIQGELYSVAWRVLDSQYFGVPQRRRRVFVVGYTGENWRAPYAVLFEPESLRRDFTPGREKGENATGAAESNPYSTKYALNFDMYSGECTEVSPSLQKERAEDTIVYPFAYGLDEDKNGWVENSGTLRHHKSGGKERAVVYDVLAFGHQNSHTQSMDVDNITPTLDKSKTPAVLYSALADDTADTLTKCANQTTGFIGEVRSTDSIARRLTPLECERLQGFPDNYTNIPGAKDAPRYAAIGNSMAVPVMRWLGQRIQLMDEILNKNPHKNAIP